MTEQEVKELFQILGLYDMEYYYQVRKRRFASPIAPPNPYIKPLISETSFKDLKATYIVRENLSLILHCDEFSQKKKGDNPFSVDKFSCLD